MIVKRPALLRSQPSDIHLLGCDCASCEPYAPSVPQFGASLAWTAAALAAGLSAGTAIVAAYDQLMPGLGVGIAAVFGS